MFQIYNLIAICCSELRKRDSCNATKTRRLSKAEIRKQSTHWLKVKIETEDVNEQADKVQNSKDAGTIIKK